MNVGILGAGNIAATMAKTLNRMQEARFYAIASRTQDRADDFARQYGAVRAYGSYEAMLADPNVDLVYIATPHALHYQQGLQCIAHGKPVLCEKAFTANAPQAKALVRSAAEHRVFITEAIWTRYMPSRALIAEVVASGELGEIVSVSANLGYPVGSRERLRSPALAGGALLDMGVYPLNFICMTLGSDIADIRSACIKKRIWGRRPGGRDPHIPGQPPGDVPRLHADRHRSAGGNLRHRGISGSRGDQQHPADHGV